MLVGYVSDERHLALCDVAVLIEGESVRAATRSRAGGGVHADLPPGRYRVTLVRDGYGAKRTEVVLPSEEPYRFRLLADGLLGYMWPKWVQAGGTSEFRVHSPEAYKLELWRYGWEKEFVRTIGWYDEHGPRATVQLTPDGDWTQTGIHWNRQGYKLAHHPQNITAPQRSGLYYLHAWTAAGDFFSFPWIVAPESPTAPVAVLTSNLTWNAYNNFGGRSNYVCQDGLPLRPTVHARTELQRYVEPDVWPFEETSAPLSFERPEPFNNVPRDARITDPISGRLPGLMAPGEWRLLGWLEREGFEYDLYSEPQLHFGKLSLEQYRVLILNTHPEYWSREMYQRVKHWVHEEGGRLMYLGGCGLYAEVELPDESSMRCRVEGRTDLRQESSANLLGVAYTHDGFQTAAPYRVVNAEHWAFRGTGLQQGDRFGLSSLHERCPGGASGHELDTIGPNSPKKLVRLAKGENPGGTGADLVAFETPGGGIVFSAGSACWSLSIPVDAGVSAVTSNVLRRLLE